MMIICSNILSLLTIVDHWWVYTTTIKLTNSSGYVLTKTSTSYALYNRFYYILNCISPIIINEIS